MKLLLSKKINLKIKKLKLDWFKVFLIFIITICFGILVIGVTTYFNHFNKGYSKNSGEWSNFASYIGLFVNILSLGLLGAISLITYRATNRYNDLQLRPHLYLTEEDKRNQRFPFNRAWVLVNGSHVAAVNILVRYTLGSFEDWTKWTTCFSLGGELNKELIWVFQPGIIEVCYSDIEGRRFYLYRVRDWNGIEMKIDKPQYDENLQQAKKNVFIGTATIINTNNITDAVIRVIADRPPIRPVADDVKIFLQNNILNKVNEK